MNFYESSIKQLLNRVMPFVFGFGLVLSTVLLLIPSYAVPKAYDFYDKAQHVLMFVMLTMVGLLAYPQRIKTTVWGLVCYGGLMEVLQSMCTTTRHGDWIDWLADSMGITVAVGAYWLSQKFIKFTINKIAV